MNDQSTVNKSSAAKVPTLPDAQTVTSVHHWTDRLFSFRVTRPQSLRFRSGEFVMIGLMGDNGRPLLRAYSIASPSWDEELEFYSIKVPDGPLTSKLQHINVGDEIIVVPSGKRSTVKEIVTYDGNRESAREDMAITLTLNDEIDISRGDIICKTDAPAEQADQFQAHIIWMSENRLFPGRQYLIKTANKTVPASVSKLCALVISPTETSVAG